MPRAKRSRQRRSRYWVQNVTTTAIAVPEGTMTRSARQIADILCTYNPRGSATSINRFIQFYINRGGRGIPAARRRALKQAMALIRKRMNPDEQP